MQWTSIGRTSAGIWISLCILTCQAAAQTIVIGSIDTALHQQKAKEMFYHGYDSYLQYALPHDELKPLSKSWSNSLGELGNLGLQHLSSSYDGVALTLIDSLSTLAVLGNASEFADKVDWVTNHVTFDQDVRVNVFEVNIRVLGGLLSAHMLAVAPDSPVYMSGYWGGLLDLAHDLGTRLLPAFLHSPTGLPYPWVNLRHGVQPGLEVNETNTAACGSLMLEMGLLSRLTGDLCFEHAAQKALRVLWGMRGPLALLGTNLDMEGGWWLDRQAGIGAGADSFYEYLLKAYLLFGEEDYWNMFCESYQAVLQHCKIGAWYREADVTTGQLVWMQFQALHSFWPGLQVLAGDVAPAIESFAQFFAVWRRFGLLPERYLYSNGQLHPTEQHYALRPELAESAFYLHQATGGLEYQDAGATMLQSLWRHTRVPGGHAAVRSVASMAKEDYMPSYFLAETCKYLYLLFNPSFLKTGRYLFTTEGHPVRLDFQRAVHWTRMAHQRKPKQPAKPAYMPRGHRPVKYHWRLTLARSNILHRAAGMQPVVAPFDGEESTCSSPPLLTPHQERTWGSWESQATALAAKVCVATSASQGQIFLCHVNDRHPDHRCADAADCGTDATTCRKRMCTPLGCATPPQA